MLHARERTQLVDECAISCHALGLGRDGESGAEPITDNKSLITPEPFTSVLCELSIAAQKDDESTDAHQDDSSLLRTTPFGHIRVCRAHCMECSASIASEGSLLVRSGTNMPKGPAPITDKMSAILRGWALPVGFAALAVVLLATSRSVDIPVPPPTVIEASLLEVGPRRAALQDPPVIEVEGVAENCTACHQIFRSASPAGAVLGYHREITLQHGMNDRCINCHDVEDRERLTLRDGTTIPFAQTPLLCAQCHGTVFRDWERGTHGKTLGSWITGSEAQRRLSCNECHDPHSPRYPPYAPLPGPNTLRMGTPSEHDGAGHRRNPLQHWLHHDRSAKPQGARP